MRVIYTVLLVLALVEVTFVILFTRAAHGRRPG